MLRFAIISISIFFATALAAHEDQNPYLHRAPSLVLPLVTTSAIIEVVDVDGTKHGVVFIDQPLMLDTSSSHSGRTLPGGAVHFGESVEEAIERIISESLGISVNHLAQLHTYSGAHMHCHWRPLVEVVFTAQTGDIEILCQKAPDVLVVAYEDILSLEIDEHSLVVVRDYLAKNQPPSEESEMHILPVKEEEEDEVQILPVVTGEDDEVDILPVEEDEDSDEPLKPGSIRPEQRAP